jgi:hypothetical protein
LEGINIGGFGSYGKGWSDIKLNFDSILIDYHNPPAAPPEGEHFPEVTYFNCPNNLIIGNYGDFSVRGIDADGDKIFYKWDWGDGTTSDWLGPYNSGETVTNEYSYDSPGNYFIRVQAKDDSQYELLSKITEPFETTVFRPNGNIIINEPDNDDVWIVHPSRFNEIAWEYNGDTGDYVQIDLYQGDGNGNLVFICNLFDQPIPNSGQCYVCLSNEIEGGQNYRVLIYDLEGSANFSKKFGIHNPGGRTRNMIINNWLIYLLKNSPLLSRLIEIPFIRKLLR